MSCTEYLHRGFIMSGKRLGGQRRMSGKERNKAKQSVSR